MAEHRGIQQFFGILTHPLFSERTTRYQSPRSATKKPRKVAIAVFDLQGVLELRDGGGYAIEGEEFTVSADTWVVGVPKHGVMAKVKGTFEEGVAISTCLVVCYD